MNIQWYPGHMTKTKRMMKENFKLIDIVIELVDARLPLSSKNPDMHEMWNNKPRIIIINKCDLGDSNIINQWKRWYENQGYGVILVNSINGQGINKVFDMSRDKCSEIIERDRKRGRIFRPIRAMIVGIPNVGKSTFINKLVGKSTAKTGNKPGVTRGKQWIKLKKGIELLDTPGILWPKFEDKNVALKLAFIGSIKDEILDKYTLGYKLVEYFKVNYPSIIKDKYDIDNIDDMEPNEILKLIAKSRSLIKQGNEVDDERAANLIIDDFRRNKLGYFTLEKPEDIK